MKEIKLETFEEFLKVLKSRQSVRLVKFKLGNPWVKAGEGVVMGKSVLLTAYDPLFGERISYELVKDRRGVATEWPEIHARLEREQYVVSLGEF